METYLWSGASILFGAASRRIRKSTVVPCVPRYQSSRGRDVVRPLCSLIVSIFMFSSARAADRHFELVMGNNAPVCEKLLEFYRSIEGELLLDDRGERWEELHSDKLSMLGFSPPRAAIMQASFNLQDIWNGATFSTRGRFYQVASFEDHIDRLVAVGNNVTLGSDEVVSSFAYVYQTLPPQALETPISASKYFRAPALIVSPGNYDAPPAGIDWRPPVVDDVGPLDTRSTTIGILSGRADIVPIGHDGRLYWIQREFADNKEIRVFEIVSPLFINGGMSFSAQSSESSRRSAAGIPISVNKDVCYISPNIAH